jgi:hypothetical protein
MSIDEADLETPGKPKPASTRTRILFVVSLVYALWAVATVVQRTGARADSETATDGGPTASVVFTAVGNSDAAGHAARAALAAERGASFHLSIGDLGPIDQLPDGWCAATKAYADADVPLEVLASPAELDAIDDLSAATQCVPDVLHADGAPPDHMAADVGDIVRLIGIAPHPLVADGSSAYAPGSKLHGWLSDAIRSARTEPGRWVVVAVSSPCIGPALCPAGRALLDTLLAERVDVVLFGGRSGYQRDRPIGAAPGCPPVELQDLEDLAEACMAVPASIGRMEAGAGTLMVLAGTGGGDLDDGAAKASPDGLVAVTSADGDVADSGLLVVTATPDELVLEQIGLDGKVDDSFTITHHPTS